MNTHIVLSVITLNPRWENKMKKFRDIKQHISEASGHMVEASELNESVEVSSDFYQYAHGKKPSGHGAWMFTPHRSGVHTSHKEGVNYISVTGKYGEAKKKAQSWAKSLGHTKIHVAESVELSEDSLKDKFKRQWDRVVDPMKQVKKDLNDPKMKTWERDRRIEVGRGTPEDIADRDKETVDKLDKGRTDIHKKHQLGESTQDKVTIHSPGHRLHGVTANVFHRHGDGRINVQVTNSVKKGDVLNLTLNKDQYKTSDDTPFSGPYTTKKRVVAGKKGEGYSVARHLARLGMKKVLNKEEFSTPQKHDYNGLKESLIQDFNTDILEEGCKTDSDIKKKMGYKSLKSLKPTAKEVEVTVPGVGRMNKEQAKKHYNFSEGVGIFDEPSKAELMAAKAGESILKSAEKIKNLFVSKENQTNTTGVMDKPEKKKPVVAKESFEQVDEMAGAGMNTRAIHKHLTKAGWSLTRTSGGHDVYTHPKSDRHIPVPRHRGDLKAPLVLGILKQSRIQENVDLNEVLRAPEGRKTHDGEFQNKEHGTWYTYKKTNHPWAKKHDLPHEIDVADGVRFGHVKGTVAHIATDENDDGSPKMEKWGIKNHSKWIKENFGLTESRKSDIVKDAWKNARPKKEETSEPQSDDEKKSDTRKDTFQKDPELNDGLSKE